VHPRVDEEIRSLHAPLGCSTVSYHVLAHRGDKHSVKMNSVQCTAVSCGLYRPSASVVEHTYVALCT
jgi:hypothetical protein